jgi:subtilase family serine protease
MVSGILFPTLWKFVFLLNNKYFAASRDGLRTLDWNESLPFTFSKEIIMKCYMIFVLVLAFVLPLGQPAAHAADQRMKARITAAPKNKTAKSARPDLVVSKINYSPGSPKENEEITIWVFVKNIGQNRADLSGLRLQVGGESASIAPVAQVPALNPGKEWRYERKVTFSRAGNYRITATADAQNALTESNENNNRMTKDIRVKPGAKPDLVVTKINFSPGSPWQNEQITIWVFVKNIGQGKAAASGLRVQAGGESISVAPVAQVPALDPGREWRYERKVTFGKAGAYLITATADAQNALNETKEGNNKKKRKINVKPGTKPDPSTYLPDLGLMGGTRIGGKTWQNLNTPAVTLTSNDVYVMDYGKVQIQLKYEYREYNGKAVNTPFKNRVYFNNQLVHEEVVSSLSANEIRNKTVVWEIPNPNYNQQAQLKIVIDATDTVTESRTNNNENKTTITFSGL